MSDHRTWESLLSILLPKPLHRYSFEITGTGVVFKGRQKDIEKVRETLTKALSTQTDFDESLPYTYINKPSIGKISTISQTATQKVIPIEDSVESGVSILRNLLGEEAFAELGMGLHQLFGKGAFVKDGVMYSIPTSRSTVTTTWADAVADLSLPFSKVESGEVSLDQLLCTWKGSCQPLLKPLVEASDAQIEGGYNQFQPLKVVIHQQPYKAYITFDYRSIVERSTIPVMNTIAPKEKGSVELHINKSHFLARARHLSQGLLWKVTYSNDNPNEAHGQLIFVPKKVAEVEQDCILLIVDRSGSMYDTFNDLKKELIDALRHLEQSNADARVRIVFFETDIGPIGEFGISEFDKIAKFISDTTTGSRTNLYGTLDSELQRIIDGSSKRVKKAIFITDGYDSVAESESEKLPRLTNKMSQFTSNSRPEFHAVGFGTQLDKKALKALASTFNSPYSEHLNLVDFLKDIKSRLSAKILPRDMVKILHDTHEYEVPVYHSDSPQTHQISYAWQPDKPLVISVNGRKMEFKLDSKKIPSATVLDQLGYYSVEIYKVVVDDSLSMTQQNIKLQAIKHKIDQCAEFKEHPKLKESAKGELDRLVKQLRQLEAQPDLRDSFVSDWKYNQDFFFAETYNQLQIAASWGAQIGCDVSANTGSCGVSSSEPESNTVFGFGAQAAMLGAHSDSAVQSQREAISLVTGLALLGLYSAPPLIKAAQKASAAALSWWNRKPVTHEQVARNLKQIQQQYDSMLKLTDNLSELNAKTKTLQRWGKELHEIATVKWLTQQHEKQLNKLSSEMNSMKIAEKLDVVKEAYHALGKSLRRLKDIYLELSDADKRWLEEVIETMKEWKADLGKLSKISEFSQEHEHEIEQLGLDISYMQQKGIKATALDVLCKLTEELSLQPDAQEDSFVLSFS